MSRSKPWVLNTIAAVLLFPWILSLGVIGYWSLNRLWTPTEFYDPHVTGPTVLHVRDVVHVAYTVIRHQTCKLEISRLARRPDRREIQLQYVIQLISATDVPQPSGYTAEIVPGVLNEGEDEVDLIILSRVQYFCNELDYWHARVVDMEGVHIKVVR